MMNITLKKTLKYLSVAGVAYFAVNTLTGIAFAKNTSGMDATPNAQMQAVLNELQKLGPKPLSTLSADEARKQPTPADAVKALLKKKNGNLLDPKPEEVGNVENKSIDGPGGPIPIRIYTPKGNGPFPVIVYYHGGGWVIADLDIYDSSPRALVNATNAVVVSSHYRQGPEHKFPAAHDDALAAYKWAIEHTKELNGDPKRIAVVGESAGGNLAASVSVLARERHMPLPIYQVLVYPIAGYNFETPSYIENANAKPLSRDAMKWFFTQYLNSPEDGQNHLISLVNEKNLKGLPPTTIITDQIDPLRSEGKDYADKLQEAGVNVRYKNYDGVTHEFFGMGAVLDKARQAQQFAAEGLKKAFQ